MVDDVSAPGKSFDKKAWFHECLCEHIEFDESFRLNVIFATGDSSLAARLEGKVLNLDNLVIEE